MIHDRLCIREVRLLSPRAAENKEEVHEEDEAKAQEEEEEKSLYTERRGTRKEKPMGSCDPPRASGIIEGSVNQYAATKRATNKTIHPPLSRLS